MGSIPREGSIASSCAGHTHVMSDRAVYTTLDGDGAPYRVAATGRGIVAAAWEPDEDAFVDALRGRLRIPVAPVSGVPEDDPARRILDASVPLIVDMLRGRAASSTAIPIDLDDRPPFDRRALEAVRGVDWGETASYGDIAQRIGAPRAARAVGGALGRNPISMIIPCHRIIASDGTLGGYGGDGWLDRDRQRSRKEALLLREGVTVSRRDG
jgi:methylated-DNA-[protein]-cysteine S-methyltransferase